MKESPFGPLDILDAHAHLFSHNFFATLARQMRELGEGQDAVAKAGELTGWTMPPEDPARLGELWVGELERHGVAAALLMASVPADEDSIAAAVAAADGRILGAFMIDPTRGATATRTARAFDQLGLRVACLFPAMHHFSVASSEGAREAVALAAERPGTAVFVHFGALSVGVRKKLGLPSRFDLRYSNPIDLHPVACEFPKANFIIPHFGAGMLREALMVADLCPNVHLDTSSSNKWTAFHTPPLELADVFRQAIAVAGHERLLFGSDSSFFPRGWNAPVYDAQVAALEKAGASADQARAIFGGNLKRLLGL